MSVITTDRDRQSVLQSGKILSSSLAAVAKAVRPGVSTAELNTIAESAIKAAGGLPAFKGYNGFPAVLCASINSEVVHGIPRTDRLLVEGDSVGLDLGVIVDGWYTDSAITVGVGKISPRLQDLINATRDSLAAAVGIIKTGCTLGDIGAAVQGSLKGTGYGIVRDLVGHGIGRELHEPPQIPNVGKRGTGARLTAGQLIAVEPMVTLGSAAVKLLDDGWTYATSDGSPAAHFEQTLLVTDDGCTIVTPF